MSYRELNDDEQALLSARLCRSAARLGGEHPVEIWKLQAQYDSLLGDANRADEEVDLLGYAFGCQLASVEWLDWALLIDEEYGDAFAIAVDGLEVGCAPLDMIRNRLEDGVGFAGATRDDASSP